VLKKNSKDTDSELPGAIAAIAVAVKISLFKLHILQLTEQYSPSFLASINSKRQNGPAATALPHMGRR
jgi:hypothetical protein